MCFFKKLFSKKKAKKEAELAEKTEEKVYAEAELIEDDETEEDNTTQEVVNVNTNVETEEVQEAEAYVEPTQNEVEETEDVEIVEKAVVEEEPTVEVQEEEVITEEVQVEVQEEVPAEEIKAEEVPEDSNTNANVWEPVEVETAEEPVQVKKPTKKASTKKATKKVVEEPKVEEVKTEVKTKQFVTTLTADDKLIIEGNPTIPHGKFVIKKTDKGNFVYKLFSYNHRVVCIGGEQYKSQVTCKNGINSVILNCQSANIEDQTLRNWEEQKCPKWQIYKDKQNLFRFRLLASNGQSIATTNDGYQSKDSAKRGIEAIKRASEGADVIRNDVLW